MMQRTAVPWVAVLCVVGLSGSAWGQGGGVEGGSRKRAGAGSNPRAGTLDAQTRALAGQIQSLEERLAAMNEELDRLRRQASGRPELLGRLDRLEALARRLQEEIAALRIRQADMERDRTQVARAMEEQKAGSWRVGYQGGFAFQSPANRFALKIKGFIVGRYRLGAVQTSDAQANPEKGLDENGFGLVDARFGFFGHVWTPKLTYALDVETAGGARIKKALVQVRPWSFWSVTIGQQKVMDSWQELSSTGRLQLLDRTRAVTNFAHGYDIGISTTFSFWNQALVAQLGVFNGAGAGLPNDDDRLLYVLRLGTAPLGPVPHIEEDAGRSPRPRLWLGTSAEFNRVGMGDLDGDGEMDEKQVYTLGAEAAFYWKGFNFQSEFFAAIGRHTVKDCPGAYPATNRACNKVDTSYGAYAQTGYIFGKGWQLAARFSYAQVFDSGWSGDLSSGTWKRSLSPLVAGPEGYRLDHVYEAGLGLLYDPFRNHLRLGLVYSFQRESFVSDSQSMNSSGLDRNVHLTSLVARVNF